jgi:hypothetical protein
MNESETASELYVSDPLSEVTRKVRRSLLGVCILSMALVKAGLLPSKITALGIELFIKEQRSLTTLLLWVVVYFLISFIVYSLSDFIAWKLDFMKAYDIEKERIESHANQNSNKPKSNISVIYDALKPRGVRRLIYPTSILRAILEFILPVVSGMYSIIALYCFTVT